MKSRLLVPALTLLALSSSSFASDHPCAYSCTLTYTHPDKSKTTLLSPDGDKSLLPVGGYTLEKNTTCAFEGEVEGLSVKANVSDVFGSYTDVNLEINDDEAGMTAPGTEGRYGLKAGPYQLVCRK